MTLFTVRRTIAAASIALVAATLATPASAHDLDEDAVATKICGASVNPDGALYDGDDESGDEVYADLYAYAFEDTAGNATALCTFAIISTDEGSTIGGSYSLSVGSLAPVAGTVSGTDFVTKAVITKVGEATSANISASGKQLTPKTAKQKKAAMAKYAKSAKAAKAAYSKVLKAAKDTYAKAGKSAKAKKAMTKKIAAAKKKYQAALAKAASAKKLGTSPTERSFSLNATAPFVA